MQIIGKMSSIITSILVKLKIVIFVSFAQLVLVVIHVILENIVKNLLDKMD